MDDSPLYPSALLGYRVWVTIDGDLRSTANRGGALWSPGINRAACWNGGNHPSPDAACGCGLYSLHELDHAIEHLIDLDRAFGDSPSMMLASHHLVIGAVVARGEARIHWNGFRAAEALPAALLVSDTQLETGAAAKLARNYGIPFFTDTPELRTYGESLASPAPAELHPEPPLSEFSEAWLHQQYPIAFGLEEQVELAEELGVGLIELWQLAVGYGVERPGCSEGEQGDEISIAPAHW